MNVELNKIDVVFMIRGTSPYNNNARYTGLTEDYGGICDKTVWKRADNEAWDAYSIEELFCLYQKLKEEEQ